VLAGSVVSRWTRDVAIKKYAELHDSPLLQDTSR